MDELLDYRYIKERLPADTELRLFELIDSTSTEARRSLLSGTVPPAVFIAEEQSEGRGRTGKSFYSPRGSGIYLSLLLDSVNASDDGIFLTSAAAVAVRRAIVSVTGASPKIKWVNDLYVDGKKICGILTEALTLGEKRYIIIGVGINLSTKAFPKEISDIAASLGVTGVRNALCAECVRNLLSVCKDPDRKTLAEEYRQFSCVLGKQITYTENGRVRHGFAKDINEYGHLIVEDDLGNTHTLSCGEISLRTK